MKHLFTLLLLLSSTAIFSQNDSTEIDTMEDDPEEFDSVHAPPDREKHFFINGSVAYGECYLHPSSEKYPELIGCRSDHERTISVPTFDVSCGYQFKRWLSVSAGVQYFETGFDHTAPMQLSDTLPSEFAIGCDVYGAVDPALGFVQAQFYDPRFFSVIHGYHPASATQKTHLRYYYVGVPVKTELSIFLAIARGGTFRSNRGPYPGWAKAFVNAAIIPNYMIKQRYDVSFQRGTWNYVYQDSMGVPAPFIRRWNLGASIGAGITYRMLENFEARVDYTVQFQLLDLFNWRLSEKLDYEEKHQIHGVAISLRYFLK